MKPIQAAIFEKKDERGGMLYEHLDVVLDTEGNVIKNRWGRVTPQWTQAAPSESGLYWLWSGDEDSVPIPVTVMYSGTDGKCFVAAGQWGWTRHQEMEELEGSWWVPCVEPALPEETRAGVPTVLSAERPQRFRWSEPVVCGCGVKEVRGYLKVDAGNTMAVLEQEAEGTWHIMSAFVPDALELMEGGMDLEGAKELAEYFLDQWIQTTGRLLL